MLRGTERGKTFEIEIEKEREGERERKRERERQRKRKRIMQCIVYFLIIFRKAKPDGTWQEWIVMAFNEKVTFHSIT